MAATQQPIDGKPESFRLVVFAYPGTDNLVAGLWKKFCPEPFGIIEMPEGADIKGCIEEVMLASSIAKEFVLIPANMVPVGRLAFSEICGAFVMMDMAGNPHYDCRLPLALDKERLVSFLPENSSLDDDAFIRKYVKEYAPRPQEVSLFFGNFISPVLRANPCRNKVIEAMVRKKFICANLQGWNAITDLLDKLLKG